ncbi:MAG: D-alanyl-D-alanine carboxypeptidase/D-alanyl-D-alanine-endopeptidase, partial [Gemmatimonadetes bacterium]|nr:D-alanyl-D-alanine carboxypeptidase/D-alanyl-D-alanine-endopeptidase [Gemmatimonadota bacterium]
FYCAPVSSMNAGHNVVIVDIRPGTDAGSPARVRIEPDLPSHIALETSAVTAAGNRRAVSARLHREAGTMEVTGILGLKRENARLAVAVSDPARYAGLWFRRALVRYGIECGGEIRVTYEPTDFTTHVRAAAHFSDPLAEIAKRILDESDNLGAECLARHLAIATAGEPATGGSPAEETGALAILRERGLPAGPPVRIDDGSGLSRTSLLAPSHLTWALIEATKEDDFVFAGVVPLAEGHRKLGTHPMADEHRARIRAKTGSFQGTRCLAGYYTDADDAPLYAFAIMVNGLPADDDQAFAFEALVIDAVSKIAARHDRP